MFAFIILTTYGQHIFYFSAEVEWGYVEWQFGAKNTKVLNYLLRLLVVVAHVYHIAVKGCWRSGRYTFYVVGAVKSFCGCRVEHVGIVLHKRRLHPGWQFVGQIGVFCDIISDLIAGQCHLAAMGDNLVCYTACGKYRCQCQLLCSINGAVCGVSGLCCKRRIRGSVEEQIIRS